MLKTIPLQTGTAADTTGTESFRPQYHFTPRHNWMNDPNGLVYFEGEYHLYFQYNPKGKGWGNMCWGHAVSTDLMSWRELPIAIPETDQMIFSGSVVVDWHNTSGLGDGTKPPLVAYFTAYNAATDIQSQHLAYSRDRGRTFTHYSANPIIDLNHANFRDPKVFYHAASQAWIMVVALSQDHLVQIYRSDNMLDWTLASSFGPAGSTAGQWECPDLIEVAIDGEAGEAVWVLKIDVDKHFIDNGSGAQYFVGSFDGHAFQIDARRGNPDGQFVDFGPDFYAAVSWSDLPETQPDPVWIGWQSNHQTGKNYPTDPWCGAQSLPRCLFLFEERGQLWLGQRPVASAESLRGKCVSQPAKRLAEGEVVKLPHSTTTFEQMLTFVTDSSSQVSVSLTDRTDKLVTFTADFATGELNFSRHVSQYSPQDNFARAVTTRVSSDRTVSLRIYFDGSLLDVFVDGGRRVYSAGIFPDGPLETQIQGKGGYISLTSCDTWDLRPSIDFS